MKKSEKTAGKSITKFSFVTEKTCARRARIYHKRQVRLSFRLSRVQARETISEKRKTILVARINRRLLRNEMAERSNKDRARILKCNKS